MTPVRYWALVSRETRFEKFLRVLANLLIIVAVSATDGAAVTMWLASRQAAGVNAAAAVRSQWT
jgi:hypothetical protein